MSNLTYTTDSTIDPTIKSPSLMNHSPWLLGCAYASLALSLISTFIKTFSQYRLTNRLMASDHYLMASSAFAVFQTITITIAIHYGLGRHQSALSLSNFESFEKAYYASNLIMIPALAAAKASYAHLLIHIFPAKRPQHLCCAILGLTALWALACIVASAFQCSPPRPWELQGTKCVNRFGLSIGVHSLNGVIDLLLISIALILMQRLRLSSRKRWTLRGLFASRLSVPVFIIIMLYYMRNIYRSRNPDLTWEALTPQIFAQIMLNASIITACLPSLIPVPSQIAPGLIISQPSEHELTTTPYARPTTSGSKTGAKNSPRLTSGFDKRLSASTKRSNTMTSRISTSSRKSKKSRLEKERQNQAISDMERGHNRPRVVKVESKIEHGRSESNQYLTDDVILHYIDYRLEYEDVSDDIDVQLDRIERAHPVSRG